MDDLIRDLLGGDGWTPHEGLEPRELSAIEQHRALEFSRLYNQVFSVGAGRVLLEHWIQTTIMRPTVQGRSHAEDGIREGRADFVRGILAQMEMARRGG